MEVIIQSDLSCGKLRLSKLNKSFCKGFYISSYARIQIYMAKIRVPSVKNRKSKDLRALSFLHSFSW